MRMYLGWAYVGNRLLSATVEYEETGWYDGQVKPVVNRVKFTLVGLAGSLILCILLYLGCVPVEGLSRKCTVTLPQGHLGLMRSVEKLICRSIAKRGA
ncbi:hypothetical protein ZEAMMB73_Zm00001d038853 [Zea mays]|nr:hypothetical protein [Zea mays]AQK88058.1 hypothetical protein ZEAMMB73_Zm00001d038853 [Zea mays]